MNNAFQGPTDSQKRPFEPASGVSEPGRLQQLDRLDRERATVGQQPGLQDGEPGVDLREGGTC
jgi:hypothetical protein